MFISVLAAVLAIAQGPATIAAPVVEPQWCSASSDLTPWKPLLNFRPPIAVQQKLIQRSSFPTPWHFHHVEDGYGPLNVDYYPIEITQMPMLNGKRVTAPELLEYVRTNLDTMLNHTYASFGTYEGIDALTYPSTTPVGSVMHFRINLVVGPISTPALDDGAVMLTNGASDQWIFSTLWTTKDLGHPVSGNRQFGYVPVGNGGFEFYTRGADRTTALADFVLSQFGVVFDSADALWSSFQQSVVDLVNGNRGSAALRTDGTRCSVRVAWPVPAAVFAPGTPWLNETYAVIDVGTLGGSTVLAAINSNGGAAGYSVASDGLRHAIVATTDANALTANLRDLGAFHGLRTEAHGINSGGVVVGSASGAISSAVGMVPVSYAVAWTPTGPHRLSQSDNAVAYDVADDGSVVGTVDVGGTPVATRWTSGDGYLTVNEAMFGDSSTFGADSYPYALTRNSTVTVGQGSTGPTGCCFAFFSDGTIHQLPRPARSAAARAVVSRDLIVGWATTVASDTVGRTTHAALWRAQSYLDLGTLGGQTSSAWGVNATQQVTGSSLLADGSRHAFIWFDENHDGRADPGLMKDLNGLLNTVAPNSGGWTLTTAISLNDHGIVAANGTHQGAMRGAVLIPMIR